VLDNRLAVWIARVVDVDRLVSIHGAVHDLPWCEREQERVVTLHAGLVVATVGLVVRNALAGVFDDALTFPDPGVGERALPLDSRLTHVEVPGMHVGDLRGRSPYHFRGGLQLASRRLLL